MGKEKFPDRDVDGDVARKAGTLEVLTPPKGLKFKVEVEMASKFEKEAGKDPLLKAEMWEKVADVYEDLVQRIVENLQKTDRGAVQLRDTNQLAKMQKLVEVVNRGIEGATRVAEGKAEKAVQDHWDELCQKRKEYLKYKIKIVTTVVGAAAGLVTSIGLMAATPFSGGASAAFGIIGMVKSIVTIGKELISAAMTVDQSIDGLRVQVEVVETLWTKTKAGGHANEVAQTVFESFVGQSTPSIKTCLSNLSTAKNKLTGVDVRNHDLAKTLQKMLDKIDELRNEFLTEAKSKLEKHPSPKAIQDLPRVRKNLDRFLEPHEARIATCIDSIQTNNQTIKTSTKALGPLEVRVKALAKMRALKAYTVLDNLLVVKDFGFAAFDGNSLVQGTKNILTNVMPVASGFAYDKVVGVALEGTILA